MTKRNLGKLLLAAAVLCAVVAFAVLVSSVASFGGSNWFTEFGGATSIAFDKAKMQTVDRAVIRAYDKTFELTDSPLLRSLVQETMAATHGGDNGCARDCTIELYSGNTLVRSMIWGTCCDAVRVYTPDISHWILPYWGSEEWGWVEMSSSLSAQLRELIGNP